jgi:HEAT repeat protein
MDLRERQSIREDLRSSDEEVRRLAVERLAALDSEALELLVERLGDASWRVRKAAVARLVASPRSELVADALLAALSDGDDPGRRNAAVEALVGCGAALVPRLLEASKSGDVDVRKLVVDALAGIRDARAVARLVEMLDDADPNVRGAAADALGTTGQAAASLALLRLATREEEPLVRLSALRALAQLDAVVTAAELGSACDDPLLRPAAYALLGRSEDPAAAEVLLKGLGSASRSAREAAIEALLRILAGSEATAAQALVARARERVPAGSRAEQDALERLVEGDLPLRLVLVQFLGLLGRRELVVPILGAGGDEALAEVAAGALEAMGAVAEDTLDEAWPQLPGAARALACRVLAGSQGARAGRRLLQALDDPDPECRVAALRALGATPRLEALPTLVRRLAAAGSEPEWDADGELEAIGSTLLAIAGGPQGPAAVAEVSDLLVARLPVAGEAERVQIARVLARLEAPGARASMGLLLADPSPAVRRNAVEALAREPAPEAATESLRIALADESPLVRIAAAGVLSLAGTPAVLEDLACLARDEDVRVRAAAVRAVASRAAGADGGTPELRERCLALLGAALDDEGAVALAAIEGLDRLGDPSSARLALVALERADPEILRAVLRCIGSHGDAESLERVLPLVAHREWSVRAEATQVLAERRVGKAIPPILRRLETEQDDFVRSVILRALARLEG